MRLTRQVIRIVTLTVTLLTATACSSGFYVELSALNRDPSVTEPTADSFAVERQIHVSWPEDPATDTYMLYRDSIPNPASPTLLYEGESLSLIDSDIIVDQTYYYRLGKRRGQRVFEPSGPVYAVGSDVRRDEHEPNDSKDSAVPLTDGMQPNMYGYRDPSGNTLLDTDWFSITIPANHRVVLAFDEFGNLGAEELVVALDQGTGELLTDGEEFPIENPALVPQRFFFRLYLNEGDFFGVGGTGVGGGSVSNYRIRIRLFQPLVAP